MLKKVFTVLAIVFGCLVPYVYSMDGSTSAISTGPGLQSDVTISTQASAFPKLLWEKEFSKPITSSAMSKDGTRIAVADETGYLTIFDAEGKKLWDYHYEGKLPKRTYEFKTDKADTAIHNIEFSASGKFIVCDLGVLNTWGQLEGFDNFKRYEPHIKLCFDSSGKLLWKTGKKGDHIVGGDNYVLIKPRLSPDSCGEGDCSLMVPAPVTYHLLDMGGKSLFSGETDGQTYANMGFSDDGEYVFVRNKLIKTSTGATVWKSSGQFVGINGNLVIQSGKICDLFTRRELLRASAEKVSLTASHVAELRVNAGMATISVHEIHSGKLLWNRQYKKNAVINSTALFYLTKDDQYLLLGGAKGFLIYDMAGNKIAELEVGSKVVWPEYFAYFVSQSGENLLAARVRAVRLYKLF